MINRLNKIRIGTRPKKSQSFLQARKFVRGLGLKTQRKWGVYRRDGAGKPARLQQQNIQENLEGVIDGSLPKKNSATTTNALKQRAVTATREWFQRLEDGELLGR
jgi:hypothetical protein